MSFNVTDVLPERGGKTNLGQQTRSGALFKFLSFQIF